MNTNKDSQNSLDSETLTPQEQAPAVDRQPVKSITVIGRRWFDKINGNTYHAARTLVNGKPGPSVAFQYGYGNQYEWNAAMELDRAGVIKLDRYSNGNAESLWQYCDRNKIAYSSDVADLPRKKDIKNW